MGQIAEMNQVKPLSANEEARLEQLEEVIQDNIEGFEKTGLALAEIRDRQLYRQTHRTFEQYFNDNFDLTRRRAYQIIEAAEVVQNVKNCSQILCTNGSQNLSTTDEQISWTPKNERQARPLAKIVKSNPGHLPKVLEMTIKTARNGKITAVHVDRVVKKYLGDQTTETIRKTRKKAAAEKQVSTAFKKAFDAFLDQINIAVKERFRHTSRLEVLKHLRAIQAAIEDVS